MGDPMKPHRYIPLVLLMTGERKCLICLRGPNAQIHRVPPRNEAGLSEDVVR